MRLLTLVVIAALAACSGGEPPAPEPVVQQSFEDGEFRFGVSVDRIQINAAESITLKLAADYPEDAALELPEAGEQLGEFLVESESSSEPILIAGDLLSVEQLVSLAPTATTINASSRTSMIRQACAMVLSLCGYHFSRRVPAGRRTCARKASIEV